MSFMLPSELADPDVRPGIEAAARGARANGTPFISFFTRDEMLALAGEAGFRKVSHVSAAALASRYFAGRSDGLRPPNNSEELLVAATKTPSSVAPTAQSGHIGVAGPKRRRYLISVCRVRGCIRGRPTKEHS
jgi:hypothetical protein